MQISLIENKIYEIRGQKVILDFDLALMYEVEAKVFKQSEMKHQQVSTRLYVYPFSERVSGFEVTNCDLKTRW
jgi:ORF6N domain